MFREARRRCRRRPPPAARLPAEITGRDRDGELVAKAPRTGRATTARPSPSMSAADKHPPGEGDHVILKLDRSPTHATSAPSMPRVLKTVGKRPQQLIGVFRAHGGGARPACSRRQEVARPGDRHRAGRDRARGWRARRRRDDPRDAFRPEDGPRGRKAGDVSSEKAASLIAIHMHGIPPRLPGVRDRRIGGRAPRHAEGTRGLARTCRSSPSNRWTRRIMTTRPCDRGRGPRQSWRYNPVDRHRPTSRPTCVPGTALDDESMLRGNTVYFPDRVVPMLPSGSRTTSARSFPRTRTALPSRCVS